jgi:hypothetical protein
VSRWTRWGAGTAVGGGPEHDFVGVGAAGARGSEHVVGDVCCNVGAGAARAVLVLILVFPGGGVYVPPMPGRWDGGDGRELLAAALVQNGVGIGLYVVPSSLPGPRGGPDECAAVVRINGGALGARAGCGFIPEILVDGVRSCCNGIP